MNCKSLALSLLFPFCTFGYIIQEADSSHYGIEVSIDVDYLLESVESQYQKIDVYQTKQCGTLLVLDKAIQITQWDNAGYQEILAHVPLFSHPAPQRVLIIGGGDGGTLTETLKHAGVQEVILCEIDEKVVELSQKYFPEFAAGFKDHRTTVVIQDAAEYIKNYTHYFDVILVDASDPSGPGCVLYTKEFYDNLKNAIKPDGIIAAQGESIFFHQDQIKQWLARNKALFTYSSYFYGLVPTYPSGMIGFLYCSDVYDGTRIRGDVTVETQLKYYTPAVHQASFCLPKFFIR